jgi:hypothetical protein
MIGAIFLTAVKKFCRKCLFLQNFFQASVVELIQPVHISAMTNILENWATKVEAA